MRYIQYRGKHATEAIFAGNAPSEHCRDWEDAGLVAALRYLFNLMDEMGYYYFETEQPDTPSLTKEQVKALPDGPVKQAAIKEWNDYARKMRWATEGQKMAALYEAAPTDDKALVDFMRIRKSYEYEGWNVEYMRVPTELA